jgi:hypothetical protein
MLVNKVLHGFELRSQLERWDDLSRRELMAMRANRLDRIVVYSTAHGDEFTFQDIQRTVGAACLDYTVHEICESLARFGGCRGPTMAAKSSAVLSFRSDRRELIFKLSQPVNTVGIQ